MITLSEGVTLFLVAGVFTVVWWGVKSLVSDNKANSLAIAGINTAIAGINTSFATTNGRIDTVEKLVEQHHDEDREKFQANAQDHKELWQAVNHR